MRAYAILSAQTHQNPEMIVNISQSELSFDSSRSPRVFSVINQPGRRRGFIARPCSPQMTPICPVNQTKAEYGALIVTVIAARVFSMTVHDGTRRYTTIPRWWAHYLMRAVPRGSCPRPSLALAS